MKKNDQQAQVNAAPAWPTRQYRWAKKGTTWAQSAEPGERESLFLSAPNLVLEREELAKRSVKISCRDIAFKCSRFPTLLPWKPAFPDFPFPFTGTPNGSPATKGVWESSCAQKISLLNVSQIHLSALQKWQQQLLFFILWVKDYGFDWKQSCKRRK